MIMTAELNSHQRVSYYTGVKLIRHHHNSSQNPSNTNSTPAPVNSSTGPQCSSSTGVFYHRQNRYPLHPQTPHHIQHHVHKQQHPPQPMPQHHQGHFHLPCPTGHPRIQHPGGMIHGPHGIPYHSQPNPHQFVPGSNQATRMYAGSPLIRSNGYFSSTGGSGAPGSNKRANRHQYTKGHQGNHVNAFGNGRHGGIGFPVNQNIIHHANISGSCSSGSSSSSSSNEHLNNLQSPTGSPVAAVKTNGAVLKLQSKINGESSPFSSNNSSPCPLTGYMDASLSSSGGTFSSASSSPSTTDGNKDLDHFYFLDDHWKPSSDDGNAGLRMATSEDLDFNGPFHRNGFWKSSNGDSPSPPVTSSMNPSNFTLMVDQFFAIGDNNESFATNGFPDENNNYIDLNESDRDQNNNVIEQPRLMTGQSSNDHLHNGSVFDTLTSNTTGDGSEGLHNGMYLNRPRPANLATVVNVETQIGTFNGQRDLEIRLCFIKGDRHGSSDKSFHRGNHGTNEFTAHVPGRRSIDATIVTAIGDPFKSTSSIAATEQHPKFQSSTAKNEPVENTDTIAILAAKS